MLDPFSVLETSLALAVLEKLHIRLASCIFLSKIKSDVSSYKLCVMGICCPSKK